MKAALDWVRRYFSPDARAARNFAKAGRYIDRALKLKGSR